MSILIKNMEMPKSCRECPLETDYGTCGYYSLYVEAGHESDFEKRRDDCPLISVPPHGRLIDADALEELFREVIGNIAKHKEIEPVLEHMVRASAMVIEMIDDAPTVIPAEPGEEETCTKDS